MIRIRVPPYPAAAAALLLRPRRPLAWCSRVARRMLSMSHEQQEHVHAGAEQHVNTESVAVRR